MVFSLLYCKHAAVHTRIHITYKIMCKLAVHVMGKASGQPYATSSSGFWSQKSHAEFQLWGRGGRRPQFPVVQGFNCISFCNFCQGCFFDFLVFFWGWGRWHFAFISTNSVRGCPIKMSVGGAGHGRIRDGSCVCSDLLRVRFALVFNPREQGASFPRPPLPPPCASPALPTSHPAGC